MATLDCSPLEEAAKCRRQAMAFAGQPEGPILLHIAEAFEALAGCRSDESTGSGCPTPAAAAPRATKTLVAPITS